MPTLRPPHLASRPELAIIQTPHIPDPNLNKLSHNHKTYPDANPNLAEPLVLKVCCP